MQRKEWETLFNVPGKKGFEMIRQKHNANSYDKMMGLFFQSQQAWVIMQQMEQINHESTTI